MRALSIVSTQRAERGLLPRAASPAGHVVGLMLIAVVLLIGCDSAGPPRRTVVPTMGRVMVQGRPAAGALVVLHPATDVGNPQAWWAGYPRATVGPLGDFRLTTYVAADGAPPGAYVVCVTWPQVVSFGEDEAESAGSSLTAFGGSWDRLAGRFADPTTSTIRCVVAGQATNLGRIELQP